MKKKVLITGISGQDGSYLADLKLGEGFEVIGLTRDPGLAHGPNLAHLKGKITLLPCTYEQADLERILSSVKPDEIYNFAGQTYVTKSWEMQEETLRASAVLPTLLLEAIVRTNRKAKFFQASSCEVYSLRSGEVFHEDTPLTPGNPYGCAKAYAQNMVAAYRHSYGLFAVSGVLFHHESPRRHENFASQKVVRQAVRIKLGLESKLVLGNMEVSRDWGYAPDYVRAASLMLSRPAPQDYVICTGEQNSLRNLVELTFEMLGLDYRKHVTLDPGLVRPSEPLAIQGSSARARKELGWAPSVSFRQMLEKMVHMQLALQQGQTKDFSDEHPF